MATRMPLMLLDDDGNFYMNMSQEEISAFKNEDLEDEDEIDCHTIDFKTDRYECMQNWVESAVLYMVIDGDHLGNSFELSTTIVTYTELEMARKIFYKAINYFMWSFPFKGNYISKIYFNSDLCVVINFKKKGDWKNLREYLRSIINYYLECITSVEEKDVDLMQLSRNYQGPQIRSLWVLWYVFFKPFTVWSTVKMKKMIITLRIAKWKANLWIARAKAKMRAAAITVMGIDMNKEES